MNLPKNLILKSAVNKMILKYGFISVLSFIFVKSLFFRFHQKSSIYYKIIVFFVFSLILIFNCSSCFGISMYINYFLNFMVNLIFYCGIVYIASERGFIKNNIFIIFIYASLFISAAFPYISELIEKY